MIGNNHEIKYYIHIILIPSVLWFMTVERFLLDFLSIYFTVAFFLIRLKLFAFESDFWLSFLFVKNWFLSYNYLDYAAVLI